MSIFDLLTMGRKKSREDRYRQQQSERAREDARLKKKLGAYAMPSDYDKLATSNVGAYAYWPGEVLTLDKINELMDAITDKSMPLDPNGYYSFSDPSGQYSRAFRMGLSPGQILPVGSAWGGAQTHQVQLRWPYQKDGMRLSTYYDVAGRCVLFAYAYPNGGHTAAVERAQGVNKDDQIYFITHDVNEGRKQFAANVSDLPLWTPALET